VTPPNGSSSTAGASSAPAEIGVSFKDVVEGRAFIRLPFVSKLILCHWAGAPWADKDPDAHLHGLQTEVMAHREREQIVHGASRLGKSVLGGCKGVVAAHIPKRKGAVVAANYMHVGHEWQYLYKGVRRLWRDHPQAIKRLTFKNQHNYYDFDCEMVWDTRLIGISTENEEGAALLGREITDVILGEGSHISKNIFETKLLRAADGALMGLGDFDSMLEIGNISIFTTPKETQGCSASEWERVMKQTRRKPELLHVGRVPWAQSVWIREASILENPAYDRRVFNVRKNTLTARAFEEQYLGKMGNASGRVYSAMEDTRHVVPRPPPDLIRGMKLGVGFDTGAFTAISLCGLTKQRKRWVLGEVQTEKQTLSYSVARMKEMLVEVLRPVFLTDDADEIIKYIDVWAIDPASQHKLDLMEQLGDEIGLEHPNARDQRFLLESTNKLNTWFEEDGLFIAEECELTVDQYRKWLWKVVKQKGLEATFVKEPAKGNDHLCDASRFILLCLENHGPHVTPPRPVTFKEAWERAQRDAVHGPLQRMLADAREREEIIGVRSEEDRRPGGRARLLEVLG
jgi:hypothetical protein